MRLGRVPAVQAPRRSGGDAQEQQRFPDPRGSKWSCLPGGVQAGDNAQVFHDRPESQYEVACAAMSSR